MSRTLLILAGALFIGGLFVVYLYREEFIASEIGGAPIPVLVAFIDIPIGVPVRDEWLTERTIPEAYVESRHIPTDMRREIVGLPLAQAVVAGEALLRSDLSPLSGAAGNLSGVVPPGMRAITLPTTHTSTHTGLLQPGDRVDVLLTVGEFGNPQAGRNVVVLQNILVLAYGLDVHRETAGERGGEGGSTSVTRSTNVTLQVTVDEAALLTQARSPNGEIHLIIRNPNDSAVSTTRIADVQWEDLVDLTRRNRFVRVAVRSLIPVMPPIGDPALEGVPGAAPVVPSFPTAGGVPPTVPVPAGG